MKGVVAVVIKKEDKFLMVQEAKETCYGKWNFPGGRIKDGENIFDAAKREAKEETGYDVELLGILSIQNLIDEKNKLKFIFNANVITGDISYDKNEILKAKWFTINELENMNSDKLRNKLSILEILNDFKDQKNYPLKIIKNIIEK